MDISKQEEIYTIDDICALPDGITVVHQAHLLVHIILERLENIFCHTVTDNPPAVPG